MYKFKTNKKKFLNKLFSSNKNKSKVKLNSPYEISSINFQNKL